MRSLSSSSTSNADCSQSNNISSHSSQKGLSDDDNDCFPRNGLPEDFPNTRDEERINDIHGERIFRRISATHLYFCICVHSLHAFNVHNYRLGRSSG